MKVIFHLADIFDIPWKGEPLAVQMVIIERNKEILQEIRKWMNENLIDYSSKNTEILWHTSHDSFITKTAIQFIMSEEQAVLFHLRFGYGVN